MAKGGKQPGAGRPKGTTNEKADKIRDAIYAALMGRIDELNALEMKDLVSAAVKILPRQLEGGDPAKPLTIAINMSIDDS